MLVPDFGKAVAGIIAWAIVAALALVATEYWDAFWGALLVLAAVIAMWLVGERILASDEGE